MTVSLMTLDPSVQMPAQMSTFAPAVDDIYYFIYWMSVVFLVGITGAAAYFSWKYKRKPGVKAEPTGHNTVLEIGWTVAPIFVLIYLFHAGFKGYLDLAVAPADAMEVRVRGLQWSWDFEYPNGAHMNQLVVPVNKPVKLIMSSSDVLHAFFVPAFRVKRDLVPGMYTSLWFQATQTGETNVFCAEYCGGRSTENAQSGHWSMITKAKILSADEFDKQMSAAVGPPEGKTTEQWGEILYKSKNCFGCHTVDGSKGAGPSWKGKFGSTETLSDGSQIKIDENYIRESMLDPQAKIVQGFGPVMPTYKGILNDKEIDALISYIKTLK